jgi:hypothetical protein
MLPIVRSRARRARAAHPSNPITAVAAPANSSVPRAPIVSTRTPPITSAAVECFELAIDRDERAGALIWAMHHRLRLGEALLARGQTAEALPLLKLVAARAPEMGLRRLAEHARCATISA